MAACPECRCAPSRAKLAVGVPRVQHWLQPDTARMLERGRVLPPRRGLGARVLGLHAPCLAERAERITTCDAGDPAELFVTV
eukprot:scaffold17764_cov33-Tisochrysis_lutea.AAC.2